MVNGLWFGVLLTVDTEKSTEKLMSAIGTIVSVSTWTWNMNMLDFLCNLQWNSYVYWFSENIYSYLFVFIVFIE